MRERKKASDGLGRRFAGLLCVLGLVACAAAPASAGASSAFPVPGLSLVFANGNARSVADNLAVPVRCLGSGRGFCSGVVTLSRDGHHISIPFSVRGGGHDLLFVPLRLGAGQGHLRKVHGVATTAQTAGPPTSIKQFLYAE